MYDFEFDDNKSVSNLSKHGINFVSAQALWNDPDLVEIQTISSDELRFLVIGCIANKHWSVVITKLLIKNLMIIMRTLLMILTCLL
jgi:uncharacterized DUF497 family protein